jgi:peroxiredoxin
MSKLGNRLATTIVVSASLLVPLGLSSTPLSADISVAQLRKDAPTFALTDSNGVRVALSDYRGNVVLLDFWATWCTGCKVEIPWYMEFQKKYKDKGLRSIGVAMDDEGWEAVKPYLALHPITYPIVLGNEGPGKQYGVANLPVTLLIDRKGKIADSHLGMVDKGTWEKEIQQLLQEKAK